MTSDFAPIATAPRDGTLFRIIRDAAGTPTHRAPTFAALCDLNLQGV